VVKTEYLISVNTKENICSDKKSFENLLMTNRNIKIEENKIIYKDVEYGYKNQENKISNTDIIYYHVTIEILSNGVPVKVEKINDYEVLLRDIRIILMKITSEIEILWDDLSFYYSQNAYPLIYEIENLMRKLLTKFMLINVGTKWEKENIPSKISKSKNTDKEINLGNGLLYQLDFIELSNFLFDEYALNKNINDLQKKVKKDEDIPLKMLDDFLYKSNWERYFKDIVQVENEHLRKQWDELYKLRCKIAHNNMFTKENYNKVNSIIAELKPSVETAIAQLDKITVDDNVKERVTESFAVINKEHLGEFIIEYNKLENSLQNLLQIIGAEDKLFEMRKNSLSSKSINFLLENKIITEEEYKKLKVMIYKRNNLVHGHSNIPELFMKVNSMNIFVKKLIEFTFVYFWGVKILF
jgi:cell division septum initiation protein DivIVA